MPVPVPGELCGIPDSVGGPASTPNREDGVPSSTGTGNGTISGRRRGWFYPSRGSEVVVIWLPPHHVELLCCCVAVAVSVQRCAASWHSEAKEECRVGAQKAPRQLLVPGGAT